MNVMNMNTHRLFALAGLGLLAGISVTTLQGCDPGAVADVCDLSCPTEGVLEGNASITGIASIDGFFGAVVDVNAAALSISGSLRSELDGIAVSLGLEPGAASADIVAAINLKFGAALDGGLKIDFQPPRCEASVEVAVAAAAECDVEVDPGMATVECSGGCEVEGGVMASCEADATLKCTGTAPMFQCEGSCEGSCEMELGGTCEGTCRGGCDAGCSVVDAQGDCAGECTGTCSGTCELKAGGNCDGDCTGSCTYTPPEGAGCEANASAKCEAMAGGSIECDAKCEGEVTPPSVSAECEASVEAKADASIECFPPSLEVTWQWSAEYEADATGMLQAEFKAWLEGFKGHISVMLAARTKADILVESLGNLRVAAETSLEASFMVLAEGDFAAAIKVPCAVAQLPDAAGLIADASGDLQASASASIEVFGAVGI
jgi:hypothetical protein